MHLRQPNAGGKTGLKIKPALCAASPDNRSGRRGNSMPDGQCCAPGSENFPAHFCSIRPKTGSNIQPGLSEALHDFIHSAWLEKQLDHYLVSAVREIGNYP